MGVEVGLVCKCLRMISRNKKTLLTPRATVITYNSFDIPRNSAQMVLHMNSSTCCLGCESYFCASVHDRKTAGTNKLFTTSTLVRL